MAGRRKYSKKTLKEAVQAYFDSITREVEIKERVDSGKRDSYGHVIWELVPVQNKLGETAKTTEYLVPPTIGGLCLHLGISYATWSRWHTGEENEDIAGILEDVRDRMLAWRMEQVLSRKDVKGLVWELEVNYGVGAKEKDGGGVSVTLGAELEEYSG